MTAFAQTLLLWMALTGIWGSSTWISLHYLRRFLERAQEDEQKHEDDLAGPRPWRHAAGANH